MKRKREEGRGERKGERREIACTQTQHSTAPDQVTSVTVPVTAVLVDNRALCWRA